MKYKILLTGNNKTIINEFFTHMSFTFECMNTSARYDDIINHLKYIRPDIFVYCLYGEKSDDLKNFVNIGHELSKNNIPIVVIGSLDECDLFIRTVPSIKITTLHRPILYQNIKTTITKILEEKNTKQQNIYHLQEKTKQEDSYYLQEKTRQEDNYHLQEETKQEDIDEIEDMEEIIQAAQKRLSEMFGEQNLNQKKHILIVDDDRNVLKLVKNYLTKEYEVATAINGKVAMKFLESKKTDLVLLDYEMPEENGPAVLSKIRSNNKTKNLPVVFLTGISDKGKIQEVLTMKPQGYILKPINIERLSSCIKSILG